MNGSNPVSSIGERPLIARLSEIFRSTLTPEIIIGAGPDDCAVVDITDEECLVVTTDMLHRQTDFPPQMSPWQIGWMAAAVNFSDVAAMGARPVGILSALGFPADTDVGFVEEIARGISDCARTCGAPVIGGDIDTHEELTITGTAIGRVKKSELLTRKGARVGDKVCVTGHAGSAGAALRALENGIHVSRSLLRTLFEPMPRTAEAQRLAASGTVTAMTDTSDGLAMSLHDLAAVGGVGFRIYEDALPVLDEVRVVAGNSGDLRELVLYTGGDFELLFTVSPEMVGVAQNVCNLNVLGDVIGQEEGVDIKCTDGVVECVDRKGYEQLANR
jgi:thiamine-monophosphate kinase